MKKKIAGIALVVLLVGLIVSGCSTGRINELESQIATLQTDKTAAEAEVVALQDEKVATVAERDGLKSDLEDKITELNNKNSQLEEISTVLGERDAEISKLEEEKVELQAEVECLGKPPLEQVSKKAAGRIDQQTAIEEGRKLFERVGGSGSTGVSSYILESVETLEKFLKNDITDHCPHCRQNPYDAGDGWAFQLKDHWIKAGLSPFSLGLVKMEIDTTYGRMLVWRNMFLTKENGQLVFYEVDPCSDKITKIEEPSEKHRIVFFSDKLWIIR